MLIPAVYQVKTITHDTSDVFTLTLTPTEDGKKMAFSPGQFNMLYHFGFGEVAISISGDPSSPDAFVHTIRAVGSVTKSMQELKAGDEIGVRGPFGSEWPLSKKHCDVLVIAGGIGLAPLRPALFDLAAQKNQYRDITLLYGVRNPEEILYKKDLESWQAQGIKIETTVDYADVSWQGQVGVVTSLIKKNIKDPKNTLVFICGPEVMIKFAVHELLGAEAEENHIFISLERNMQCAVGFCGRCQYGPYFLCKDGPVFSYEQLRHWITIKEL
jgi:NAD(P)H-flavin reductase